MTLWVAIVGSGPAGCYTAEALIKALGDNVRIDIFDRLPTPYGLIRGGVAPDHQSIKAVSQRYDKTVERSNVRFIGNVEINGMLTVPELRQLYDAVVLATGAPLERPLSIPGAHLPGVIGSAAFVGWYNGHPDFVDLDIDLNVEAVAIIGNGNVAIDVARVLAKTPKEMATSDLAAYAAKKIQAAPIREITIFGRRGPLEASFTPKELGELNALENCVAVVDAKQLPELPEGVEPAVAKNLRHLSAIACNQPGTRAKTLRIAFFARPVAILGEQRVTGLRLERTRVEHGQSMGSGEFFEISCGLVVPCIGYRTLPLPDVPFDEKHGHYVNRDGNIGPGLYATGWARRGPSGTIGTNRPDGFEIASQIVAQVKSSGKLGGAGFDTIAKERNLQPVDFAAWQRINAAEIAAAGPGAPRAKFLTREALLRAAKGPSQ